MRTGSWATAARHEQCGAGKKAGEKWEKGGFSGFSMVILWS